MKTSLLALLPLLWGCAANDTPIAVEPVDPAVLFEHSTFPDAALGGRARPGVVRPLVKARIKDRGVVLEEVLGAVPVVDVKVDDRDPLESVDLLEVARGDRCVVDETKAHGSRRLGVVSRRPDKTERVPPLSRDDPVSGEERRAR